MVDAADPAATGASLGLRVSVELTTVADDGATFHDGIDVDRATGYGARGTGHGARRTSFTASHSGRCHARTYAAVPLRTVNDLHFGEVETGRISDHEGAPVHRASRAARGTGCRTSR